MNSHPKTTDLPPRCRKVTTLDMPTKDKVLDVETKKMIEYVSSTVNLSKGKRYRCWWCTLVIDGESLGCPIGASCEASATYSTDGVFCSFNCVKAYINEKERTDVMYKNSHVLLAHMFCEMKGCIQPVTVTPSPEKSLLAEYGGHMTEDQYRHCFDRIVYTKKGIIKMFPTTAIFQEEEKLNRDNAQTRITQDGKYAVRNHLPEIKK